MIEGSGSGSRARSGSGSKSLTSGSGSGRPKNMWIRIRIRNTGKNPGKQNNTASEGASIEDEWVARRTTEWEPEELAEPQRCLDVASTRLQGVNATTQHVSRISLIHLLWSLCFQKFCHERGKGVGGSIKEGWVVGRAVMRRYKAGKMIVSVFVVHKTKGKNVDNVRSPQFPPSMQLAQKFLFALLYKKGCNNKLQTVNWRKGSKCANLSRSRS